MIHIIITSFKEPKSTVRAVKSFLKQKINVPFEIIVVDPFVETEKFVKKYVKDKRVKFFLDPGEGKSYALNILFQEYGSENNKDLFVLTDGDVYVSEQTLEKITKVFEDESIGCVTGKPVALDSRSTKYGYFAHMFFEGIDRVRKRLSSNKSFFECSGYLFAIRKGVIMDFPLETSEDSIIPYLFWEKGYKIGYAPDAEVYVKNPGNLKDFIRQKVRNIKAHENLSILAPKMPRTKSFLNEIRWGTFFALSYSKSLTEFIWTLEAFCLRLYIYLYAFFEIKNKKYNDGWRGEGLTESTKTLD